MTASKYEAMARTEDPKSNQWKRFDLDGELTGLVHGLANLSGAPSVISPPPALTPAHTNTGNLSPLLTHDGADQPNPHDGAVDDDKKSEAIRVVEVIEVVREDESKEV